MPDTFTKDISMLKNFIADETGASLVEYGLLVGLIAVVAIAAVSTLGGKINAVFTRIVTEMNNANV